MDLQFLLIATMLFPKSNHVLSSSLLYPGPSFAQIKATHESKWHIRKNNKNNKKAPSRHCKVEDIKKSIELEKPGCSHWNTMQPSTH